MILHSKVSGCIKKLTMLMKLTAKQKLFLRGCQNYHVYSDRHPYRRLTYPLMSETPPVRHRVSVFVGITATPIGLRNGQQKGNRCVHFLDNRQELRHCCFLFAFRFALTSKRMDCLISFGSDVQCLMTHCKSADREGKSECFSEFPTDFPTCEFSD